MNLKTLPSPTRRLFYLLALPLPLLVVGLFFFPLIVVVIAADIFILLVAWVDYRHTLRVFKLSFSVAKPRFFSIGRRNHILLYIYSESRRGLRVELKADVPESWQVVEEPGVIAVEVGEKKEIELVYRPLRRGVFKVDFIHYRYKTASGLLEIYGKWKVDLEIEVYPDVKEVNHYLTLTRRNRLSEMGIHKNRYRGMGTNLEYLREYQKDDDSKRIDWKASTRANKLVCKEYQMETNNLIAIVLDCGRVMTAEQDGLNSLDYAVNAALILAYVARKAGDNVTVFAFSDRIIGELPPVKGKGMMNKVLQFMTKLQPDFVESNYQQVFEHLEVRLKRRALVVFFSDLVDDINYGLFYKYLSMLGRKHIPLMILLRDTLLMKNADLPPGKIEDVYVSAAAADMYMRRAEVIKKFRQRRVNLLDLLPHEVTPAVIDKYLDLKSRNLI
jgi:uncharacterized protein (DUF58 family)